MRAAVLLLPIIAAAAVAVASAPPGGNATMDVDIEAELNAALADMNAAMIGSSRTAARMSMFPSPPE